MSPIEETVGFVLAQVCKAHRNRTDATLKQINLHVGQEMILIRLWRTEGVTQSQLVEQLCVEPPTVTKMLQRMEQEGLLQRRADPEDARVSRVFLTDQGRALQKDVEAAWHSVDERTTAGLTFEERILLRRLLLQVRNNLTDS